MHIRNAQVHMESAYRYYEEHSEKLQIDLRRSKIPNQNSAMLQDPERLQQDIADLSALAISSSVKQSGSVEAADNELDPLQQLELEVSILKKIVERLTGKKLVFSNRSFDTQDVPNLQQSQVAQPTMQTSMRVEYSERYEESESVSLSSSALVKTADGREITVDLAIQMSRQFVSEKSLSLRTGEAFKDPLVINLSSASVALDQQRFSFDLDIDGSPDSVPALASHSAFLALDKNQDGVINDGSELFGAKTGNGFAELSQYDDDKNGWIDENDNVFSNLKLWMKTGSEDLLLDIQDKNIGALYLGNLATPFSLKSADQEMLGKVRNTGFYLTEDGKAGTMQQIDVTT